MRKIKLYTILSSLLVLLVASSCSVEPDYYSQTVPETFYESQDNVWQRFNRPFTHWRWYVADASERWCMQELGTDEVCQPTRGSDWYDGGQYLRWHYHEYSTEMSNIYNGFYGFAMGVALAWDALEDIDQFVDFEAMGFPEGTKESMLMQQQTLAASFYLDGLDFFGGVPLYLSTREELKGRATAEETFHFIDSLLTTALPKLPKKTELGAKETGTISQATAAALKAKLYFGAKQYIGKDMFADCAQICRDIIGGVYGAYQLEEDWTNVFGFNNDTSTEIIWTCPSDFSGLQTNGGFYDRWFHYNSRVYLGDIDQNGNNGLALIPTLDPKGNPYPYRLGGIYSRFHDKDIRKQPYVYEGNGKYRGIFMVGEQTNPITGKSATGSREYSGQLLNLVDQIAHFKKVGTEYASVDELPSNILTAEENSGVRLIKRSPIPNLDDRTLRFNPDVPIIRLAEMYYMLAECEFRAGNKGEAAKLFNTVRKRYFEGADPDPVTEANLEKYRILDEWQFEFLGEGRRRTDLIRWDAYVTEDWWDHKATNNPEINRFPIPQRIISANNLIEQNPGYGSNH